VRLPLAAKLRGAVVRPEAEVPADLDLLKQRPPSVMSLIDDTLAAREEDLHYFRPSMLSGCRRANVFHYQHAPTNPQRVGATMQKHLDVGTALHGVVQQYLEEHPGCFFAPEAKVYLPQLRIRGSCDGIIFRRKDMYRWGLEIKTTTHDKFQKLTGPLEDHVRQASIYARISGVWWITILYWDKDKQHMREYPVPYNPTYWKEEVVDRVQELIGYVDANELPAYDREECAESLSFCSFSDHCHRLLGRPVPGRTKSMY
jgi:hypothetical protein